MNKKFIDYLFPILFIIFIIVLIGIYFLIKSEGTKCMANPLIYGVNKTASVNNQGFVCTCSTDKGVGIIVNGNNMSLVPSSSHYDYNKDINFSSFVR